MNMTCCLNLAQVTPLAHLTIRLDSVGPKTEHSTRFFLIATNPLSGLFLRVFIDDVLSGKGCIFENGANLHHQDAKLAYSKCCQ